MKFFKGMIIGTAIATGMAIMYNEGMMNKKRILILKYSFIFHLFLL